MIAEIEGGRFRYVRVALGGVGTKPWRSLEAERALTERPRNERVIVQAAKAAMTDARPHSQNGFKVTLAQLCIAQALRVVTGMVPA